MIRAALIICALAGPAASQSPVAEPLSGDAFGAYVEGKTLLFGRRGEAPYGAESYLSGRRVIWTFLDGICTEGEWYDENGAICFLYQDRETPVCWHMFRDEDGLIALADDGGAALFEVTDTSESMICGGLGV